MARRALLSFTLLTPTTIPAQVAAHEFRELHMGLEVRLVLHSDAAKARVASRLAFDRIAVLEDILSDWRPASEVRRLEVHPLGTPIPISHELFEVLARAMTIAAASDGAFDPTVGAITALWRDQRRTAVQPAPEIVAAARATVGFRRVELDSSRRTVRLGLPGTRLDLGGIAKGWILDRVRDTLAALGITAVLLEAGGDIVTGAAPPGTAGWRIAVATAHGDSVITVQHLAVATSGPQFQRIQDADGTWRSHVIDPHTGKGLISTGQVTVIGAEGAIADALATALTVMDEKRGDALAARFGVSVVR